MSTSRSFFVSSVCFTRQEEEGGGGGGDSSELHHYCYVLFEGGEIDFMRRDYEDVGCDTKVIGWSLHLHFSE